MIVGEASILVRMDTSNAAAEMKAGLSGDLASMGAAGEEAGLAAGAGASRGVEKGLKDTETAAKESGGKIQGAMVNAISGVGGMFGIQSDAMKSKLESLNLPAIGVAAGIGAIGFEAFKSGEKFQEATALIASKAAITQQQATKIGQTFLDTAGQVTFSGTEIATAYAGVSAQLGEINGKALGSKQALDVMTASINLAEAGGTSLSSAASDVAKTLQAFQLPVKDASMVTDVLWESANRTGNSVDGLSNRMDMIRARMGAAAPPIKDMGGLMLDLANHGEIGRAAMMGLNAVTTGIVTPSKQAADAQKFLGLSFLDAQGKLKPMGDIIAQVSPLLGKMTEAQGLAMLKSIGFGSAAKTLYTTIKDGQGVYESDVAKVSEVGSAHEAAEKKTSDFADSWKKVKAGVSDALTELGSKMLPVLANVMQQVDKFIQKVVKDWPEIQHAFESMWKIAGPILEMLWQAVSKVFGWLIDHKAVLIGLISAFAAAWLALNPVTALILGLGLAAAELIKHWQAVKEFFVNLWHSILNDLGPVINAIKIYWDSLALEIKVAWDVVVAIFKSAWDYIKGVFEIAFDLITGIWNAFKDLFTGQWGKLWDDIKNTIGKVWNDIKGIFTGIFGNITALFHQVWNNIASFFLQIWNQMKGVVMTALNGIVSFFAQLPGRIFTAMGDVVKTVFGAWVTWNVWILSNVLIPIVKFFAQLPMTLVAALGNIVSTVFGALLQAGSWINANVFGPILSFFRGLPGRIFTALGDIVGTIFQGLLKAAQWVNDNMVTPVVNKIKELPGDVITLGRDIMNSIFDNIGDAAQWAYDHLVKPVVDMIKSIPSRIAGVGKDILGAMGGGISSAASTLTGGLLAEGGVVTKPGLFVVGEAGPEAVIPLTNPQRAAEIMGLPSGTTGVGTGAVHPTLAGAGLAGGSRGGGKHVVQHFSITGIPTDDASSIMREASWMMRTASD